MTTGPSEIPAQAIAVQGEEMLQPDEVAAMVRLHELGWGAKRLSKEFGCARNTVRRYLRAGGVVPFVNRRSIGTPYRRANGTPFSLHRSIDVGRGFRAAGGVGRA